MDPLPLAAGDDEPGAVGSRALGIWEIFPHQSEGWHLCGERARTGAAVSAATTHGASAKVTP
jgi:hypothetical protein